MLFSTLYPASGVWPSHRIFVQTRLRHLLMSREVETRVVARMPCYPDGVAMTKIGKAVGKPLVTAACGTAINLISQLAKRRRMILDVACDRAAIITVGAALKDLMVDFGGTAVVAAQLSGEHRKTWPAMKKSC